MFNMGGILANLYVLWPGVSIGIMFIGGLLALYLCTRNCCGLLLTLFFAAISTACGIALFYSGFSRPLGITLITVGVLMKIGIIIAYIYHRVTGKILCYYYEDEEDPGDYSGDDCVTYPLTTNPTRFPQPQPGRSYLAGSAIEPCQLGRACRQIDPAFLPQGQRGRLIPVIYNNSPLYESRLA